MKYLLVMSFSGSTMAGIYMLLRFLFKDNMSARQQYLFVRAAMLYYLIPLPFMKKWYESIAGYLFPEKGTKAIQISMIWQGYAVYANGKIYINHYLKIQLIVIFLWLLLSFFLLLFRVTDYIRTRKLILSYADRIITKKEDSFFENLKRQYGLKRKITLYRCNTEGGSMSFGIFRPVILYSREMEKTDAEFILRHELIHIKRWDILWKILKQLVLCLHWWNPMAWILSYDFDWICEWSCDEMVVQGKMKEERKKYARLLIMESTKEKYGNSALLKLGMNFENADAANRLEKRVENIMKMKKGNKLMAGIITTLLILANSLTVFAYADPIHETCEGSVTQEEIDKKLEGTCWQFIPNGISEKDLSGFKSYVSERDEIKYDEQFTDEDDNIYRISDSTSAVTHANCTDEYVSGTVSRHFKKPDGNCVLETYFAQRCSKCGNVLTGRRINEIKFAICPH
ncbi:MAG: M56 family metallopeptidase [Lachnospiraceae bacterium]|nr:M56 family metallopeptidase [Lachnospiraceae bacterium]